MLPSVTTAIGAVLVLLGIGFYLGAGRTSVTALIPAFFGAVLLVLGYVAIRVPRWRKHVMHVAAAVVLLGLLGTIRGLTRLPALLAGEPLERPGAVAAQSIMAVLCLTLLALYVWSFIEARRKRDRVDREKP